MGTHHHFKAHAHREEVDPLRLDQVPVVRRNDDRAVFGLNIVARVDQYCRAQKPERFDVAAFDAARRSVKPCSGTAPIFTTRSGATTRQTRQGNRSPKWSSARYPPDLLSYLWEKEVLEARSGREVHVASGVSLHRVVRLGHQAALI